MGSQRVGHNLATEQQQQHIKGRRGQLDEIPTGQIWVGLSSKTNKVGTRLSHTEFEKKKKKTNKCEKEGEI